MSNSKYIINRLRKKRIEARMSQEEFALAIGYNNYNSISRIEKGQSDLRLSDFIKACEVLNIEPTELLQGENNIFDYKKRYEKLVRTLEKILSENKLNEIEQSQQP